VTERLVPLFAAANRLSGEIAEAEEAAVRDVLAVAGPDIFGALAILTQAIGAIVAERVEAETRRTVVHAVSIAIGRSAGIRAAQRDAGLD